MNTLIKLQVPMPRELKIKGFKKAREYGFSSLQEVIRFFLTGFTKNKIVPSFQDEESVSPRALKRIRKILKESRDDIRLGNLKPLTPEEARKLLE